MVSLALHVGVPTFSPCVPPLHQSSSQPEEVECVSDTQFKKQLTCLHFLSCLLWNVPGVLIYDLRASAGS